MRSSTIFAAIAAMALGATTTVLGGEKIKLPTGPAKAVPQVTTAIDHGTAPITNVAYPLRAWRNGYAYYGGYSPYYSYRPYYGGYGYGYGGYYTRPYYGYSYYTPGWAYGPGVGVSVGPGVGIGVGPVARLGGWYW